MSGETRGKVGPFRIMNGRGFLTKMVEYQKANVHELDLHGKRLSRIEGLDKVRLTSVEIDF